MLANTDIFEYKPEKDTKKAGANAPALFFFRAFVLGVAFKLFPHRGPQYVYITPYAWGGLIISFRYALMMNHTALLVA